jgi:hypothetical protein
MTFSIITLETCMLSVINSKCHYAECHYAECHHAECRYAECRGASRSKDRSSEFHLPGLMTA